MRVTLPHQLGREEVRRRLRDHSHEIADQFPGGMATVATNWTSEDHMTLGVSAMGQQVSGDIEIFDEHVVIALELPPALSFISPIIEGAVKSTGQRLLEAK